MTSSQGCQISTPLEEGVYGTLSSVDCPAATRAVFRIEQWSYRRSELAQSGTRQVGTEEHTGKRRNRQFTDSAIEHVCHWELFGIEKSIPWDAVFDRVMGGTDTVPLGGPLPGTGIGGWMERRLSAMRVLPFWNFNRNVKICLARGVRIGRPMCL